MASVHGHLTGTPSPAVVTRGPGAAAAANGAAQATLDRHPLVLVTDTVPQAHRGRVPHQRIDQQAMLAPVTKHTQVLTDATPADEVVRLVRLAHEGRPGAVHLDYDAGGTTTSASAPRDRSAGPLSSTTTSATTTAQAQIRAATRPVVIVGLGALDCGVEVGEHLEAFGAPVLTTYQAIGTVPSESAICAGLFTNGASERALLAQADLIVTVGLDAVEPIPAPWDYAAPVVALAAHPEPDPYIDKAIDVLGDLPDLVRSLLLGDHEWPPNAGASHRETIRAQLATAEPPTERCLTPVTLVQAAASACPDDVTVTVDAGAHFLAIMPFWPVRSPDQLLISNGLATMGFALPAAIGAALARPGSPVLCLVGDGGLGMTLAELETIARLQLPIAVVVFNDAALSLIEIKQREGHGGEAAVKYLPTDFAAVAAASGVESMKVTSPAQLADALAGGWDSPLLLDVAVDPAQYRNLIGVTRG